MSKHNIYQRAYMPPWLMNTDIVAPCICGEDLEEDSPFVVAESQYGLKRWWHPRCWHNYSVEDDD